MTNPTFGEFLLWTGSPSRPSSSALEISARALIDQLAELFLQERADAMNANEDAPTGPTLRVIDGGRTHVRDAAEMQCMAAHPSARRTDTRVLASLTGR